MLKGQKILVIRYGTNIITDCIEKHMEIESQYGYCWFGKLGTAPSQKVIQSVLSEECPKIILYSKGQAYMASVIEIVKDKPLEAYPNYYNEYLFDKMLFPSIYFKLMQIQKMNISELEEYYVLSSGNKLPITLNNSMSSFFLARYGNEGERIMKINNDKKRVGFEEIASKKNCKFLSEGYCKNERCINYLYECMHPELCLKRTI